MKFCEYCIKDKELSAIIHSNSDEQNECPTCHKKNVKLYDIEQQDYLEPYFEDLLGIYIPDSELPDDFPKGQEKDLVEDIRERWHIFSELQKDDVHEILSNLYNKISLDNPKIFKELVGIPQLYDKEFLKNHSLLRNGQWEDFVNEIKTVNRYHSPYINFDILKRYCSYMRKSYKKGSKFYRARVSGKDGFPASQMSAPPLGQSSEGRANAKGVTCLYLANNYETAFHEVRAAAFDYICMGTLEVNQDITVVNLQDIARVSPFVEGLECREHAINIEHLQKLNHEMSKPLRRGDSALEYVPTQYIVDFIKSIHHNGIHEYDGVEYQSTTNPGGYNIAIFNPELFQCTSIEVVIINKFAYPYDEVK